MPPAVSDEDGELREVVRLTVAVDTRDNQPCDEIGYAMPALVQLQLVNSSLASVRDLGTSLRHLRVLRASRCGLREMDGIHALPLLEELYLAFNDIWDLTSIAMHERIQVGEPKSVFLFIFMKRIMKLN